MATFLGATCGLPGAASARGPRLFEDRSFGVGTAIGGGYSLATVEVRSVDWLTTHTPVVVLTHTPVVLLPSLEVRIFFSGERSLDISVPIVNTLIIAMTNHFAAVGVEAFYNLNFELGSNRTRLLLGPGFGLNVAVGGGNSGTGAASFRIPVVVGVEFMTLERNVGFQIRAHPWVEAGFGKVASIAPSPLGAGVMAEIAILGYGLSPR